MLPQKSKYSASTKLIVFLQSDNVYMEEVASFWHTAFNVNLDESA